MSIRFIYTVSLLLVIQVFLYSCDSHPSSGKNIFRYNESAGISTLDPAFSKNQALIWPVHQLFNTLVEYDDQLKIQPSIATSWDFSQDRRSVTFHLRNDVRFHDDPCFPGGKGRKLNANDVVFSFNRILQPSTGSPGAWIFHGITDSIEPFAALNDSTFQLHMCRPFVPVLGILSMSYCSIIPQEAVHYYGKDFRAHPVGTGPFQFLSWTEGQALLLKKNPNYFEKDSNGITLPYLDGIHISFYESKATEFMEFNQGRLDFINDVDPSFKDNLLTKTGRLREEWQDRIRLEKGPYLNTEYLGILSGGQANDRSASILQRVEVRKLIRHAIHLDRLLFYMRNSLGTPAAYGFVPPILLQGTSMSHHEFNPALEMEKLKAAGIHFDPSNPIVLETVSTYAEIGSFMAAELSKIGIPMKVEVMPKSMLLEKMAKSQVSFFRGSWIADYPDPENFLSVFYGKNPAPPNYTRFNHQGFDSLYEAAIVEINDDQRRKYYQSMDSLLMEQLPVIPLWYDMTVHFYQKNIRGTISDPRNMLELRRVRKS